MIDILDYFSTWSALKWIILVLIAGFIGQFGKMLAQAIIRKIQLARSNKQNLPTIETAPEKNQTLPHDTSVMTEPRTPSTAGRIDKKALKILAKQSKKEAKKNN